MSKSGGILIVIIAIVITCAVIMFIQISPRHQAKSVVDEFYGYEQEGRFAESWDLFHSQMKDRFKKGDYMDDRAHVFLGHFGVNTFSYTLDDVDKIEGWKMRNGSEAFDTAFRITVTQSYKGGDYGNFDIVQDVIAVEEEKGEWRVLWDYNK